MGIILNTSDLALGDRNPKITWLVSGKARNQPQTAQLQSLSYHLLNDIGGYSSLP